MNIVIPSSYTILSSNAVDESYPQWNVSTNYVIGDKVIYNYIMYEAIANNVGKQPDISSLDWTALGYVNSRRMFDQYLSTVTTRADSLHVELSCVKVNKIVLMNVDAKDVTVTVNYNGTDVYTSSLTLFESTSSTWSDYFFGEHMYRHIATFDIPLYNVITLKIDVNNLGLMASVGICFVGYNKPIGKSLYAPKVNIVDYSRKTTDEWGRTYLSKGASASKVTCDVFLDAAAIDNIYKTIDSIRATPCVFDFNNDDSNFETLTVYGWYEDFDVGLSNGYAAHASFTVQGLI